MSVSASALELQGIPSELVDHRQWVSWKYEQRDGKATKVPYDARGNGRASSTDPATWTGFNEAIAALANSDGIGFVVTKDDPYCGVDIDHCISQTGEITPLAQKIIQRLASYTEITPSKAGVRIWLKGQLPPNGCRRAFPDGSQIEFYDSGRYFTVTGEHLEETPTTIEDRQTQLDAVHGELFSKAAPAPRQAPGLSLTDTDLVEKASRSKYGREFSDLMDGRVDGFPSRSEADLALVSRLRFWTGGDASQIDRIFRRSGLMRDKWDERRGQSTYGQDTIARALDQGGEVYRPAKSSVTLPMQTAKVEPAGAADRKAPDSKNGPITTAAEFVAAIPEEPRWLCKPWLAAGALTEISGKVKAAGKTTFVLAMIRAILDGDPFLGVPTIKARVVYLTEQGGTSFRQALRRAGLEGSTDLFILKWRDVVGKEWPEVAAYAADYAKRVGAEVIVVDTLSKFAGIKGDSENDAGAADSAMAPLQMAAADGIATLTVRHDRKGGGEVGESGRGSSAYTGAVDIVLNLKRQEGQGRPEVRVLQALSRFDDTPDSMVIELAADGHYLSLGTEADLAYREAKAAILSALPEQPEEMEADALATALNGPDKKLTGTQNRALKDLAASGEIGKSGKGRRGDAFRYWRPPVSFSPRICAVQRESILSP